MNRKRLEEALNYGFGLTLILLAGIVITAWVSIAGRLMGINIVEYLEDWTFWMVFPPFWFVFGFLYKTFYFAYWDKRKKRK